MSSVFRHYGEPAIGDTLVREAVGFVPRAMPWDDVRHHGAACDGETDDSAIVQGRIDRASLVAAATAEGACAVRLPAGTTRASVQLKQGVWLVGAGAEGGFGYLPSGPDQTELLAAGAGYAIDTPATHVKCCGVVGVNVRGLGAGTAVGGIRFRDVDYGTIKNVGIHSVADEGVLLGSSCTACHLDGILVTQAVLNRSRSAVIGAIDLHGTDHWVGRIEAGISGSIEGTLQSADMYCAAIVVRASSCFFDRAAGEISDVGFHVTGAFNRFVGCRADLNYGHGWRLVGASLNQFATCQGLSNSQDATNTHSNYHVDANSLFNMFSNCYAESLTAKKAKYGFEDLVTVATGKNQYVGCFSRSATTAQYQMQTTGSVFVVPSGGGAKTLTANSATPDVTGHCVFTTANTGATTITDFTGGVPGQRLTVWCNDANTTVQHNGTTLATPTGANVALASGRVYEFVKYGAVWRFVGGA